MKMDTSLLQCDPEALGQIPMKYQDNNQVSFLIRVQKNVQYHRFVQIIKVILYLHLIFATAVIGCIILSNYYSSQNYIDNTINRPTSASDRNGGSSRLNLDAVPDDRIPWRTKQVDTIVSSKQNQNPFESAKFVAMVDDFDRNEKSTSPGSISFEVNEDNEHKIVSDLSKIEKILGNWDTQPKLPIPNPMSVISSSKIDDASSSSPLLQENDSQNLHSTNDIVSSNEDVSKYTFSDDLDDDQIIQLLIEKLLSGKAILADTDFSSDSNSWADEIPLINLKSKRSADSSSSESSSSSSSSESENSETPPNNRTAAIEMLAEILKKMDQSDCDPNSNENVTSNGDRADRNRSLRKRLVAGILEAPMPDCGALQPSLAVDKCGEISYRCPLHQIENERSGKHTG